MNISRIFLPTPLKNKTTNIYFFLSGGADGRYTLVKAVDYHSLHLPKGVKYMIQAIHTTLVNRYHDTLNFWLASRGPEITAVRVSLFSMLLP